MKRIINKKLYNTDTAREITSYSEGYRGDFSRYEETLYRKKTGEFFLCGSGGPASKYCEYVEQNTRIDGSGIIPLTQEEAEDWVERYCCTSTYVDLFGEPDE